MAMENAAKAVLQNPSLLDEVFNYYFQGPTLSSRGLTDRRSCLAAALTCKSFLSPALDVLWRDLDNVVHLFKLIPGVTSLNQKLYLDKPLTLSDINFLRGYARRVKHLYLGTDLKGEVLGAIDTLILSQLQSFLSNMDEYLFPCLRRLSISTHQDEDGINRGSPYLSLFVSPMLQSINITRDNIQLNQGEAWPHRAPAFSVFFQALTGSPPDQLKHLSTCLSLAHDTLFNVAKISSLQSIFLDIEGQSFITLPDIQILTALQHLKSLIFKLHHPMREPAGLSGTEKLLFPSLENLTVHSDIQSSTRLFSIFRFPALKKLKTHFNSLTRGNAEAWLHLFTALVRSAPGLVELRFHSHRSEVYKNDGSKSVCIPMAPFLALHTLPLESLTIQNPRVQSLSNEDFSQLASAFPQLRCLNLMAKEMATIDASALLTTASKLPRLALLSLPVNLSIALPILPCKPRTIRHDKVRTLMFHAITPPSPQVFFDPKRAHDIAVFIDTLFPNILSVRNAANKMNDNLFKMLNDFVQGLQGARGREREYVLKTELDGASAAGSVTLDNSQTFIDLSGLE